MNLFDDIAKIIKERAGAQSNGVWAPAPATTAQTSGSAYQDAVNNYVLSRYGQQILPKMRNYSTSPEWKQELADNINNPQMKLGSEGQFTPEGARAYLMDLYGIKSNLANTGFFDTREFALGGYHTNSSTDFLNNLLDTLQGERTSWEQEQADLLAANKAAYPEYDAASKKAAEWRDYFGLVGYDTPQLEDMLRAEGIYKGTAPRTIDDFNLMDDETFDREIDALEEWYNGLDPASLMQDPEPLTPSTNDDGGLQYQIDKIQRELDGRAEIERLTAVAYGLENFGELSQYVASDAFGEGFDPRNFTLYGDYAPIALHEYINTGDTNVKFRMMEGGSETVDRWSNAGYDWLFPDEIAVYNALYSSGDKVGAQQYLNALESRLLERRAEYQRMLVSDFATASPVTAVLSNVGAGLATIPNALNFPFMAIQAMSEEGLDPNSAFGDYGRFHDTVGSSQGQWIEENTDWKIGETNVAKWVYDAFSSIRDAGVAIGTGVAAGGLTGLPQYAGTISMLIQSSNTASSTLQKDIEAGWSPLGAVLHSLAAGGIEALTEKYSIDAILADPKTFTKAFLKSMGTEAMEEGASHLLNPVAEKLVAEMTGNYDSWKAQAYDLVAAKKYANVDEAMKAIVTDWAKQLPEAMLMGAISGGVLGGTSAGIQIGQDVGAGKSVLKNADIDEFISIGEQMPRDSTSYEAAQALKNLQAKGKKLSLRELGRLANALTGDIKGQAAESIKRIYEESITKRLVEVGADFASATQLAPIIRKIANGEKLTVTERGKIAWSDEASWVTKEITTDSGVGTDPHLEHGWKEELAGRVGSAMAEAHGKIIQAQSAMNAKTRAKEAAAKAAEENAKKADTTATEVDKSAKEMVEAGKDKLEGASENSVAYETVDGSEGTGELVRFEQAADGDLDAVVKAQDADGKATETKVSIKDIYGAVTEGVASVADFIKRGIESGRAISATEASSMLNMIKQAGEDVQSYVAGFQRVYDAGYSGLDMPATTMDANLAQIIYDQGKAEGVADEEARVKKAGNVRANSAGVVTWLGQVSSDADVKGFGSADGLNEALGKMTSMQRSVVKIVQAYAQKFKTNVVLFESGADGIGRVQNGSYDPNTNTLYIDINSGANTAVDIEAGKAGNTLGAAVLRTLGHELTHHLESTSAAAYANFKQAVKNELKKAGKDWATLVRSKIDVAHATGRKISYAAAEAEVIADASEFMLQNTKFAQEIDESTRGKVKKFIQNFMQKLSDVFRSITGMHEETKAIRKLIRGVWQYTGDLQKLWDAAMDESIGAVQDGAVEATDTASDVAAEPVKLSPRDADYLSAVERGDVETAQKMVDEAAKEAGYTVRAYHGSDSFGFTKFLPERSDDRTSLFFAESPDVAGSYTANKNVRGLGKPFVETKETKAEAERIIKGYASGEIQFDGDLYKAAGRYTLESWGEDGASITTKNSAEFVNAFHSVNSGTPVGGVYNAYLKLGRNLSVDARGNNWSDIYFVPDELKDNISEQMRVRGDLIAKRKEVRALADRRGITFSEAELLDKKYLALVDESNRLEEEYDTRMEELGLSGDISTRTISLYAKNHGYDSVSIANVQDIGKYDLPLDANVDTTVHIVFSSEQVKSADPVTYDDAGNVIPLSERFNAAQEDIRYSARDAIDEYQSEAMTTAADLQNPDGSRMFSLRSFTDDYDTYRGMLAKYGMDELEIKALFDTIDEVMKAIENDREILDFGWNVGREDRSFNPVKQNSDQLYKVSIDFSTLCRKRLLQQAVQERLESMYDTVLTKAERVAIRNELMKLREEGKQIEVACALCYVESTRLKSPAQIQRFFDDRRAVLVDYFAKKNKEYAKLVNAKADELIVKFGHESGTALKELSKFQRDAVHDLKRKMNTTYKPSAAEEAIIAAAMSLPGESFKTDKGLWNLKREHEEIFDAYTSFVRNATKSKGIEGDEAWWAGDSESISDSLIESMNAENGLRTQSWSDFQVIHLLDYMAAIIELSTRNAKMQSYTKVPDFVNLMGDTGVMINLSLIPKGFDGTLNYDPIEGMPIEEALALRDSFPETAGTICIGITKKHIEMLLANPDIDYVIPYHSSSLDKKTRQQMGMKVWEDFQAYQNEKNKDYPNTDSNSNKYHKKPLFSEWFDYKTVSGRANELATEVIAKLKNPTESQKVEAKRRAAEQAMKEAADRYKELCHQRGLQEKFEQFSGEPNYWKLLIDRKMINQKTGEIIEQKAVKPRFDKDRILNILSAEVNRFKKQNADKDAAVKHIVEAWENGEIRKAARSKKVRDQVSAFNDTVTVANIVASAEELDSQEQVQRSVRDLPSEISIRDVLSGMSETATMSETEKFLLRRYKEALKTLSEKEELVSAQNKIISGGATGDELVKAKNRRAIYQTQANRAAKIIRDAESNDGFARIMATSYGLVERFSREGASSVHDASNALDEEIGSLADQLKQIEADISRLAAGQKNAYARGLFDPKQLDTAAKKLKDDYGSKLSAKAIADRLALVYGEVYAAGDAETGARLFADAAKELAEDILQKSKYRYKSQVLEIIANEVGTIRLTETDRQEIRNAGLTIGQYKKAVAPYIKVTDTASDLSSYASSAAYYGHGALASILGDDTEGNLAMRLYEIIGREKAMQQEMSFDGMSEEQTVAMVMADIASTSIPLSANSKTFDYLRNQMLLYAGENAKVADQVDSAIKKAKIASARAGAMWNAAIKDANTSRMAIEYYRALEEHRRNAELLEQKQLLTEQLNSNAAKALLANSERYQKQIEDIRARRDLNADIGKQTRHIKRIVKRLNDRIVHEEDYKNVKEPLKPAVIRLVQEFIDGFGGTVFDAKTASKLSVVYAELAKEGEAPEFYSNDVDEWLQDLASMKEWDALIRAEGSSSLGAAYEKLALYTRVAEIADHIYKMVTDADTAFIDGKRESINAVSTETGTELLNAKDSKLLVGKARDAYNVFQNLIVKGNLTPQYFFESLKNSGLKRLFDGLMRGQREYAQAIRKGQEFVAGAKARYNYYAWTDMRHPIEFTTEQGHKIGLTREQMLWVYATAKREATNKLMDTHHLDEGGFKYEGNALPRLKGKMQAIPGSDRLHKISKGDVEKISDMLTQEQKDYADELVSYLSNECAAQGNKASMELFGIKKYNEEYYFPFRTADDQRYQRSDSGSASTTNDARVKHAPFTHSLRKGAKTTLVMGDFTDVISDHINLMATYSSFVVPIESMNRVLNAKVNDGANGSGNDVTIRSLVGRKHGEAAQKYIADLLKDLNGGPQVDSRGKWDAGIRLFKKNAVLGSLSVAVQQPTAYVRAFAFVDPKYFVHLTGERSKETMKRMMAYSGTAVLKEMGGFNVGMGKQAADWVANSDINDYRIFKRTKFLYDQKGLMAVKDNWADFITALPGFMDRVTWAHIWKAIEAEQADLNPGMDKNSEAFLKMVGERFDDVVNHTQVYDSILAKSQNMRGKDTLAKMATAFMAEPTLNMNMYYSAVRGGHGKKQASRIVASVVLSNVLAAAAAAAVSAWNKDDDERTAIEQYMTSFAGRLSDNLNPLSSIPYLSDIWSVMTGYEVERTDMSPIVDLFKYTTSFFDKVGDGKQLTWRDYENFLGSWANLTGIPFKNLSRDARRVRNLVGSDKSAPPASRVKYGVLDEIVPWRGTNNTAYYERYLAALKDGDKQEQYDLKDYLMSTKGVKEETITSGVRDAYKAEFLRGGIAKTDAISFLLKNDLATGDTAEKKKQSAFQYVDRWSEGTDGYSAYNTLEAAFAAGSSAGIRTAWNELTSNGYTTEQVGEQSRKILKELVKGKKITPAKATEILKAWYPYKKDADNTNKPLEWLKETE